MSEPITLARTGDRPLSFRGALIANVSTLKSVGHSAAAKHWWELRLFEVDANPAKPKTPRWVVAVSYRSHWEGATPHDAVYLATDDPAVLAALRQHRFLANVRGFPKGQEERNARQNQELTVAWEHGLSELLAVLAPEEL